MGSADGAPYGRVTADRLDELRRGAVVIGAPYRAVAIHRVAREMGLSPVVFLARRVGATDSGEPEWAVTLKPPGHRGMFAGKLEGFERKVGLNGVVACSAKVCGE